MLVLWITFCTATVAASMFSDMLRQQNDLLFNMSILEYFRHGERSMGTAQCAAQFDTLVQAIENVMIPEEEEISEAQCRLLNLSRCLVEGLNDKLDSTDRAIEVAESLENFLKIKCEFKNDLKRNEISIFLGEEEMPVLKTTKGLSFFLSSFRNTQMDRIEEPVPTFFMNLLMIEEMKDNPLWLSKIKFIIKDEFEDSHYKSFKKQISLMFNGKLLDLLKTGPVVENHLEFPVDDIVRDLRRYNGWGTSSAVSYLYGLQTLMMAIKYPEVNVAQDLWSISDIGFSQEQKMILWRVSNAFPRHHPKPLPLIEMAHNLNHGVYGLSEKAFFQRLCKLSEAGKRVEKSFQLPTLGTDLLNLSSIIDSKDEMVTKSTLSKADSIISRKNNKEAIESRRHAPKLIGLPAPNICVPYYGLPIYSNSNVHNSKQSLLKRSIKNDAAKNTNGSRDRNSTFKPTASVAKPIAPVNSLTSNSNIANASTTSQQEVSLSKKSPGIRVTVPTPIQQQDAFKLFGESIHQAKSLENSSSLESAPVFVSSAPSERPDEISNESIEENNGKTMDGSLKESQDQLSLESVEESFDKSIDGSSVAEEEDGVLRKVEDEIKVSDAVEISASKLEFFVSEENQKAKKSKKGRRKKAKKQNSPPRKQASKPIDKEENVANLPQTKSEIIPIVVATEILKPKSKTSSKSKKKKASSPSKIQKALVADPEIKEPQQSKIEFKLHESRKTSQKSLSRHSNSLKSKLSKSFSSYEELNKLLLDFEHGAVPIFSEIDEQLTEINRRNSLFDTFEFLINSKKQGMYVMDILLQSLKDHYKKWQEKKSDLGGDGEVSLAEGFSEFIRVLDLLIYSGREGFDHEKFIHGISLYILYCHIAVHLESSTGGLNYDKKQIEYITQDFKKFICIIASISNEFNQHKDELKDLILHLARVHRAQVPKKEFKDAFDLLQIAKSEGVFTSYPPSMQSWKPIFLLNAFAPSPKLADQPKDFNGLMIYLRTLSSAYSSLNIELSFELTPAIRFFSLFTESTIIAGSLDFDLIKRVVIGLFKNLYVDFVDSSRCLSSEQKVFIKDALFNFENSPSELVYPYLQAVGFSIWSHEFSFENSNAVLKFRVLNDLLNVKQLVSFSTKSTENTENAEKLLLFLNAKNYNQNDALSLLQTTSKSTVNFSKFLTEFNLKKLKNELSSSCKMVSLSEFCSSPENPTDMLYLEFSSEKFKLVSNLQLSSLCRFMDGNMWNFLESDLLNVVSMLPNFRRVKLPSSTLDLASFKFIKIVNGQKEFFTAEFLLENGMTAYPHPKLFSKVLSDVFKFIEISLDSKVAFFNENVEFSAKNNASDVAVLDKPSINLGHSIGVESSFYEISRKAWLKKEFEELTKEFYSKKKDLESKFVDFPFILGKHYFRSFSHELSTSDEKSIALKLKNVAELFKISQSFQVALNSSQEDTEENLLKALVSFEFIAIKKVAERDDLQSFYRKMVCNLKESIYFGDFKNIELFIQSVAASLLISWCHEEICNCKKTVPQKKALIALQEIKNNREKSMILILEEIVLPFFPGFPGLFVTPSFSKSLYLETRDISFSGAEMKLLFRALHDSANNIDLDNFKEFLPCFYQSLNNFNILIDSNDANNDLSFFCKSLDSISLFLGEAGKMFYDPEIIEIYVFWYKNASIEMKNFENIYSLERFSSHYFDYLLQKKRITSLAFKQLHSLSHLMMYTAHMKILLKHQDDFSTQPELRPDTVILNCEKIWVNTKVGRVRICKSFKEKYAKAEKSDYIITRADLLELLELLVDAKIFKRTSFKNSPSAIYSISQKYHRFSSAKDIFVRNTDDGTLTEDPLLVLNVLDTLLEILQ